MNKAKKATRVKAKEAAPNGVSQNGPGDSLKVDELLRQGRPMTNVCGVTEPHIRPHKVKGRIYYSYYNGTDKEIYLGTADRILQAVKGSQLSIN